MALNSLTGAIAILAQHLEVKEIPVCFSLSKTLAKKASKELSDRISKIQPEIKFNITLCPAIFSQESFEMVENADELSEYLARCSEEFLIVNAPKEKTNILPLPYVINYAESNLSEGYESAGSDIHVYLIPFTISYDALNFEDACRSLLEARDSLASQDLLSSISTLNELRDELELEFDSKTEVAYSSFWFFDEKDPLTVITEIKERSQYVLIEQYLETGEELLYWLGAIPVVTTKEKQLLIGYCTPDNFINDELIREVQPESLDDLQSLYSIHLQKYIDLIRNFQDNSIGFKVFKYKNEGAINLTVETVKRLPTFDKLIVENIEVNEEPATRLKFNVLREIDEGIPACILVQGKNESGDILAQSLVYPVSPDHMEETLDDLISQYDPESVDIEVREHTLELDPITYRPIYMEPSSPDENVSTTLH